MNRGLGDSDISIITEPSKQAKYEESSWINSFANKRFFDTLFDMISDISFTTLLDVGCGEGIPLKRLRQRGIANNLFGVDLHPGRVKLTVETIKATRFSIANARQLPFPTSHFDLTLSLETLEHIEAPQYVLQEISRVTHCYALLSVPNEPWWRLGNMVRLKYLSAFGNTPGHLNNWSKGQFIQFVESEFEVLRVANPVLWTFVLAKKKT